MMRTCTMAKDIYCYTRYGRRVHLVWFKKFKLTWCGAMYDSLQSDRKDTSGERGAVCKTCRRLKDSQL